MITLCVLVVVVLAFRMDVKSAAMAAGSALMNGGLRARLTKLLKK